VTASAEGTVPLAVRPLAVVAAVVGAVLLVVSGRYGYHRDELYFIASGRHLAWGYPDQPPLTPLLARVMTSLDSSSLVVLRLPSDLAAAATVFLTGVIARELGASRRAQLLAAVMIAFSSITLATGHLLSTATFNLTGWTALVALTLHIIRTGRNRLWLAAGLLMGVVLMDNDLPLFLAVAIGVGVLVSGPRQVFASRWLWAGAVIAIAIWSPYVLWQAHHHFPEFAIARSIAAGGSGTSAPRWAIPVQQLYLASPPLVPIWIAGLVRLLRAPALRWCRSFGVAYGVLLVLLVITGGKPYYLASMFPLLLAAGAEPTLAWFARHRVWWRAWVGFAVVGAAISAIITLPLEPLGHLHDTGIVALNYDAGETVGWPSYVTEIATAWRSLPPDANRVILAENYGEAGAVDRYGPQWHLPSAYGVQNAFWLWGPPPATATSALVFGFTHRQLEQTFVEIHRVGRLDNHVQVNDDEQGTVLWSCSGLRGPWPQLWRHLRDYG
jgi:4-amino-4-deoxy-L-arabinose transferase-like glycosyltransferase